MADLFHVTRSRDAAAIARQGLRRSSAPPAQKRGQELAETDDPDPMVEDPADVKADRDFDELLADAKRSVDGASEYPPHEHAVFFWPSKARASRAESNTSWSGAIVAVDSDALPPGCRPARGDITIADGIWRQFYQMYANHQNVNEGALYDDARRFWKDVTWYEGHNDRDSEVWMGCDVPPDAIEYIEDADTGRVVYEPTAEDQATLEDF